MIILLRQFWTERSGRERVMLGFMVAALATTLFWFVAIVPLRGALVTARDRLDRAGLESGRVATQVAALRSATRIRVAPPPGPLTDLIGRSGREAGFALTRNDAQGDDRVAIAIAAAKSAALFGWLNALARQGVAVEQIALRPNSDATLAVEATLLAQRP